MLGDNTKDSTARQNKLLDPRINTSKLHCEKFLNTCILNSFRGPAS